MLHGELHPGPMKNTVELVPKLEPVSVMVNAWPPTGGFGEVEMLLIVGATAALDTVSDDALEVRPVVLFLIVTLNVPAARIA